MSGRKVRDNYFFDSDLIEKTTNVKRLPRSYIQDLYLYEETQFQISSTKPCRYHCQITPEDCQHILYHVQDRVEFYETIIYLPLAFNYIQPAVQDIYRVRAVNQEIRCPVFNRTPACTEQDILLYHDNNFILHWLDQHKRDVQKYKVGNGILLEPIPHDTARTQYWNLQLSLNNLPVHGPEFRKRHNDACFNSIKGEFAGDPEGIYQESTALPQSQPGENFFF